MDMDTVEGTAMLAICWMLCVGDPEYGRPIMERAGLSEEEITALTELIADGYADLFSGDDASPDIPL